MIRLFGFRSDQEREWFRLLQTVQGVGAKVALAILSTLDTGALATAIATGDKASVARAPGVGPKLAARIVAELKDKAPAFGAVDPALIRLSDAVDDRRAPQPVSDAVSALVNLGYAQGQASAAIAAALRQAGEAARGEDADPAGLAGAGAVSMDSARPAIRSRARPSTRRAPQSARTTPMRRCGRRCWPSSSARSRRARTSRSSSGSSKARKDALDHVLFVGPPGLGKTTLAQIVARELGVNFRSTSGPVIAKAGDLAAQLTNLEERDVLFIDEIHRLNPAVEEILYPAMEDYQLDLIIGEGPAARSVKIELAEVHARSARRPAPGS